MNRSELREIRLTAIVHGARRPPNADVVIELAEGLEAVWDKLQGIDYGGLDSHDCATLADLESHLDAIKEHIDDADSEHERALDAIVAERDQLQAEIDTRDEELDSCQAGLDEANETIEALRAELKALRTDQGRRRKGLEGIERPEVAQGPQTPLQGNLVAKSPTPKPRGIGRKLNPG